jgi:V/A-type H+-transporting ATPase subunit B
LRVVEFQTVDYVSGPLLFIEHVKGIHFSEMVDIISPDGDLRRGQVLEVNRERAVVEVFSGTRGLDTATTRVRLSGDAARLGVGSGMLGRVFDGQGFPIDGGPPTLPEAFWDVNGLPINPAARAHPVEFIQTGISAIDGLNTLVRGQKLPIFSGFGLPAGELAAQVAADARVAGAGSERFVVVFAAMGITHREASFFRRFIADSGALGRTTMFLNLADDPTIERLMTPRVALTAAEYMAFELGKHVLVILTDMTNYCEALREVATAREEIPGRRGYPGYMYTDLATLYERAGRIRGHDGSITQLIILSMPDDDITHPIPDLTGYITEGQIVLSRELQRKGIEPPIDVLPSLSRLMNAGIGEGKTRDDHRQVADQLYSFYAEGRDLRRLVAIIGEAALSDHDRRYLEFADDFERSFIHQGSTPRSITETLDAAWSLLSGFSAAELKRIHPDVIATRRQEPPQTAEAGRATQGESR